MDGGTFSPDESAARFPASLAQTRFWLLDALDPGSPALNVAVRWTLLGPVTPARAEAAWRRIIARHEILRTALLPVDGAPVQSVSSSVPFYLRHHDLSALPEQERLLEADRLGRAEAREPFVLETAPLLRVQLITLAPDVSRMLVTLHHTACDGWSIGVLANELTAALADEALPELTLQYGDYAAWQQAWLASPAASFTKTYWLQQLANLPYVAIPGDRPPSDRGVGEIASVLVPPAVSEAMERAARAHACTQFAVALAALGRVLQARLGTDDIAIGTQLASRNDVELEPMVGCFINTAVLRLDLSGTDDWNELVKRAAQTVSEALQHGELPFELLIQALNPKRDRSRTPLFSVNLIFQRSFVAPPQRGDVTLVDMPSHSAGALYDLNFFMVQRPDGWRASCEYDTARYEAATAESMLADWVHALQGQPLGSRPSPQVAARLAALWQDILVVPSADPADSFFDLGGHSLLAARLLSRIEAAFGQKLTLADLFAEPTLGGLTRLLESATAARQPDSPAPVLALGTATEWRPLAEALGAKMPLTCLVQPAVEAFDALSPAGRIVLVASGPGCAAAIGLAAGLQQKQREVLLVLIDPAAPQRSGLLSRLRRPAGPRRFAGRTLLFSRPGGSDAGHDWADSLAGPVETIPLPQSAWETIAQRLIAACQ